MSEDFLGEFVEETVLRLEPRQPLEKCMANFTIAYSDIAVLVVATLCLFTVATRLQIAELFIQK